MKYICPLPTENELTIHYSQYYLTRFDKSDDTALVDMHSSILEYLMKYCTSPQDAAILDYGFGAGHFLKFVAQRRYAAYGYDVSEQNRNQLAAYCESARVAITFVEFGNSSSKLSDYKYDIITLFQVIEHLSDPYMTLSELSRYQNTGGLIYIECPNNDAAILCVKNAINKLLRRRKFYDTLKVPEHIYGFNKKSISILFNELGYEVLDIGDYHLSDGIHQIEGYSWWPPLWKNHRLYNPYWFAKSVMQFIDLLISKSFKRGSGLFVLARKRASSA